MKVIDVSKTKEVYTLDPTTIEIADIANKTPSMTSLDYRALVVSIDKFGQEVPVKIYRGKVVDGRHRIKACTYLGIKIKCINVPYRTSLKELGEIIMKTETRKNKSRAAKAISAYRAMEELNLSQIEAAELYGVRGSDVSRVGTLLSFPDGSKIVETLFNGKDVEIKTLEGKRIFTTVLQRINSELKKKQEAKINPIASDKNIKVGTMLSTVRGIMQRSDLNTDEWIAVFDISKKELLENKNESYDDGDISR